MATQINGSNQIQSGTISTDRLAAGILSADSTGRALIASNFFDSATVSAKFEASSIALSKLAEAVIQADGGQAFTADQSMGGFKLTNLADPVSASDAATKSYVQSFVSGLDVKKSVTVASTAALADAYTFSSTDGGTLTSNSMVAFPTIDGETLSANTDETMASSILLKNETSSQYNGIWYLHTAGINGTQQWILKRRSDANASEEVTSGMFTFIERGTVNADKGYALVTDTAIVLNTTGLSFSQFASTSASVTAGDGITVSGSTVSVRASTASSVQSIVVGSGASPAGVAVMFNATGAIEATATGIQARVDGSGIEINGSNNLALKDGGVTFAKLATAVQNKLGRYDQLETFTGSTSATQDLLFSDVDGTAGVDTAGLLVYKNGVLLSIAASDYDFDNNGGTAGVDRLTGLTRASGDRITVLYNRTLS